MAEEQKGPVVDLELRWERDLLFRGRAGALEIAIDGNTKEAVSPVQTLAFALASCMASDVVLILTRGRHPLQGLTAQLHAQRAAADPRRILSVDLRFGIVHDPIRDETFVAHRGGGARLNDEPIAVSSVAILDDALLATGFPYDRRTHLDFYLGFFGDFVARAQGVRRNGSAALDLCYVACGRIDGFWEWKLHPWDTAAGALIVREAGGTVTDFRGGSFDVFGEQTFASNSLLHPAMIRILTARMDGQPRGGA